MSVDKSRIPKLIDSSRKFIPKKRTKSMKDSFVERIARTRTTELGEVSGVMVETRSQKSSEGQKAMLEVEIHPDPALDESRAERGTEGKGNRILASVEQDQDFATSTGTVDREEMSELSVISTVIVATRRSPTDNTMMLGVTEKTATASSFSELLPIHYRKATGGEVETQEEEEDNDEQDDFRSQLSLNSSTHENGAPTNRETCSSDRFGVVRTIKKT